MCPELIDNCYIGSWEKISYVFLMAYIIGLMFGFIAGMLGNALKARKGE